MNTREKTNMRKKHFSNEFIARMFKHAHKHTLAGLSDPEQTWPTVTARNLKK